MASGYCIGQHVLFIISNNVINGLCNYYQNDQINCWINKLLNK